MAQQIIVFWRDIPAQIIVKSGRQSSRRQLPNRFQEAIDRAAMNTGLTGSDDYLDAWRRRISDIESDDHEAAAAACAQRIETGYTLERLRRIVANGGFDAEDPPSP